MSGTTLSYAQSLRVIGQDLESLSVDSFHLDKSNDQYIVQMNRSKPEKTILKRITERIQRSDGKQNPNPARFTTSQLLWSDNERRLKRGGSEGIPDANKLSLVLRVIGDFLDEKKAGDFAVSWSNDWIGVSYNRKVESFTTDNLYDLGVRMYLRRSNRVPAR
jgi:hypothetical protein